MPNPINNVTLAGTAYTDQATIADVWQAIGGAFQIANGRVYYAVQYRLSPKTSGLGNSAWSTDILLPPGSGTIPEGVIGVKFRNADPAQPATIVSAAIATAFAPVLSLTSVGTVAATMITGIIQSDGTIVAGTGFTVTHGGTGDYTVTFATAFAAAPVVTVSFDDNNFSYIAPRLTPAPTSSGFTLAIRDTGGSARDAAWSFIAQAVN